MNRKSRVGARGGEYLELDPLDDGDTNMVQQEEQEDEDEEEDVEVQHEGAEDGAKKSNGKDKKRRRKKKQRRKRSKKRAVPTTIATPSGFVVDRSELVRVMLQSLDDLGLQSAARTLEAEAGVSLEPDSVSIFRAHVLEGEWESALELIGGMQMPPEARDDAQRLILEQQYLEELEAGDVSSALMSLRGRLAPLLADNAERLHRLSSFMVLPDAATLYAQAEWSGTRAPDGKSRHVLMERLQALVPAGVMIPPHRLLTLMDQALHYQITQSRVHDASYCVGARMPLARDYEWRLPTTPQNMVGVLEGHTSDVLFVAFSPDGKLLASASKDGTVRIWDASNMQLNPFPCIRTLEVPSHGAVANAIAAAADLAIAGAAVSAQRRGPSSSSEDEPGYDDSMEDDDDDDDDDDDGGDDDDQPMLEEEDASDNPALSVAALRDRLARSGMSALASSLLASVAAVSGSAPRGAPGRVEIDAFLGAQDDEPVEVEYLSWSPDSKYLLACGASPQVVLWDASTGDVVRHFSHHTQTVSAVEWVPTEEGQFVSGGIDRRLIVQNVDGSVVHQWRSDIVQDLSVSGNGQVLAVATANSALRIYDLRDYTRQPTSIVEISRITCVTLSRDGRLALVGVTQPAEVHLWDVSSHSLVRVFEGFKQSRFIVRASFGGHAESLVLCGSEDAQVYVYHSHTGKMLHCLSGHAATVNAAAWHPNSTQAQQLLVSASDDHTMRAWATTPS